MHKSEPKGAQERFKRPAEEQLSRPTRGPRPAKGPRADQTTPTSGKSTPENGKTFEYYTFAAAMVNFAVSRNKSVWPGHGKLRRSSKSIGLASTIVKNLIIFMALGGSARRML